MVSFDGAQGNKSRVCVVARQTGVPIKVAEKIIKAYCQDLEDTLLNGVSVNIPGVFSIKVYDKRIFRGRVSSTLKAKLEQRGYKGYSVGEVNDNDGQDA